MDTLQISLCENEPEERERLAQLLSRCSIPVQHTAFESAEAFLEGYRPGLYDLVLMDIYLQGLSGVEAVRRIREEERELPVAFITASREHALDAYRLNAIQYIEKPVTQPALERVLRMADNLRKSRPGLTVFSGGSPVFIPVGELLFIEQKAHYLVFNLLGGKTIQAKGRLDDLLPQFAGQPFFRCHKSFLANLSFVTGIDREMMCFCMKEGARVYIRREDLKAARQAWESWLFSMARGEG